MGRVQGKGRDLSLDPSFFLLSESQLGGRQAGRREISAEAGTGHDGMVGAPHAGCMAVGHEVRMANDSGPLGGRADQHRKTSIGVDLLKAWIRYQVRWVVRIFNIDFFPVLFEYLPGWPAV